MRRMRCDATWNGLTKEQQQTLEEWLFFEHAGYVKVRERLQKEWGVAMSISMICRVRKRLELERLGDELSGQQALAARVGKAKTNVASLRTSAWTVIGGRLLEKAVANVETKELHHLGWLMAGMEQREIELKRLALARDKFEFRAASAALKELPRVAKMSPEEVEREEAQLQTLKERLFGKDLLAEVEE